MGRQAYRVLLLNRQLEVNGPLLNLRDFQLQKVISRRRLDTLKSLQALNVGIRNTRITGNLDKLVSSKDFSQPSLNSKDNRLNSLMI